MEYFSDDKWVMVVCFLLVLHVNGNRGCPASERSALLEFKAFLASDGTDADHLLPSWVDDDCCGWERVTCNQTTKHVVQLSLHYIRQYYGSDWLFNISLFQPLEELVVLDLSSNGIVDWTQNGGGSKRLLRLKKLQTLDLSYNLFNESIISSLKGLTLLKNLTLTANQFREFPAKDLSSFRNLVMLNLQFNSINGSVAEEGFENSTKLSRFLGKLSSLQYLDLSVNRWDGPFQLHEMYDLSDLKVLLLSDNRISSIQNLTALPNLEVLDLSDNYDLNSIPSDLGTLTSLKALSLSYNRKLNDSSSIQAICRLKRLEELDLSGIYFTGVVPSCLHSLTSLKLLDLSKNGFVGRIPSSWLARMTSLCYIDFRYNSFEAIFSFSLFANHSQLKVVRFGGYQGSFMVETEDDQGWIPQFQLKVLELPNCNLNKLANGTIPSFLLHQRELRLIDLSDNMLQGSFPGWLLANKSRLEIFRLRNNNFTGEFYLSSSLMNNLVSVDVSGNRINGMSPLNFGKLLPNLKFLNLSKNAFEGNLPSSIGDMRNLKSLDLSSNHFTGQVSVALYSCTGLWILKLSNNEFNGNFFSSRYNFSSLVVLQLNDNKFTGSFSNAEMNSNYLMYFDISNNFMSGRVPTWFRREQQGFMTLDLSNNSFAGEVPCEAFAASHVDMSYNSLSGSIPSCSYQYENLTQVHLQANNFTGSIPISLLNLSSLSVLNLRDNRLSGSIPEMIGGLSSLKILLLGGNQLDGLIPNNLCRLVGVRIVDLSNNSLSGKIPLCLSNISFGKRRGDQSDDESLADNLIFMSTAMDMDWLGLGYLLKKDVDYTYSLGFDKYFKVEIEIEFVTKNRDDFYKGDILNVMSGLDLSCNNLAGEIPFGLGNLSEIRALNLSHNRLTGPIPRSFSSLYQIESLDISSNRLTGEIPSELTQLTFLAVFSVAHNNLSGRIPYGKAQFGTFDGSSYDGNPFLCGLPLQKNCSNPSGVEDPSSSENEGKWYEIDEEVFFASFSASFSMFFVGVIAFLYMNPYWRRWVFYHGEKYALSAYYFVVDTFCQRNDEVSKNQV